MHPQDLEIKDFNYHLPDEKIAKHPLENRDSSKLLIYRNHVITEDVFSGLVNHLPSDSMLVFNNTKVVEARLFFRNHNGAIVEVFCLEPRDRSHDPSAEMQKRATIVWKCLVGNSKKWRAEILTKNFSIGKKDIHLTAKKIGREAELFLVEFNWNDDLLSFADILHAAGAMPIPPYVHREADAGDVQNYQTVYAKKLGSVAAPTAGLHFTNQLFEKLQDQKIPIDFVTLHVGAGTFMPVKSETIRQHEMHAEYFEVSKELVEQLANNTNANVVAVGTTTLRTLESLYWMGIKLNQIQEEKKSSDIAAEDISVKQWDPYALPVDVPAGEALHGLLSWMNKNNLHKLIAETRIIIAPPYRLRIAKSLVTNFHQPKSTLLLLVAAVIGDNWKKVYEYALNNKFRFLSYGDSCLFFPVYD